MNVPSWDRHGRAKIAADGLNTRPARHRFRWTRTCDGDADPGAELLGEVAGRRVIELGCGAGDNLAHLVERGARGVGLDPARSQILRARARWPEPLFHHVDAARYLASCAKADTIFSTYGALGLYPTAPLLALICQALRLGGLLAASAPLGSGTDVGSRYTVRLSDGGTAPVIRFDHTPDGWRDLLTAAGFADVEITVVEESAAPNTVILRARRPEHHHR
ncbi:MULTISPECIES: bifunctional 2-polyprenyl-6-hydroxyphenol methylase/3-demethylubiquinol 3-O-methyltransferase UbiG [unclassified Frankia]|uniref:class I SAM-dependent methyltransferase n=1 Tax=unclassified Frankia TaxID=2632575 RepID=UPI0004610EC5|nr:MULTISPECIES: methyltransferase domain-containing protein [unclassified Frankia]KDA41202.1 hypothetical protein BMG523Draft_03983 [Frankia sp. BMG5.23]OFB39874.1 hypothetical protein Manayef4_19970 [Frankia sp. CgIM4]